jgi:1,4-alpha-glucan branching enzyme
MDTKLGAFTFVLHSHIPYCRRAGRWPHGEEWIHEAAVGCYLPLLSAFRTLAADGVAFRLTISMTPVLLEQLADGLVRAHLTEFIQEKLQRAVADVARFEATGDGRLAVARFYVDHFQWLQRLYEDELGGDIVGEFRRLQDQGYLEVAASAATHGYLPLLSRDSSIAAQIGVGVQTYARHFGRRPRSFWLPECAYRPAYVADDGHIRPGLETFLAEEGVHVFFAETHAIEGGRPVGKAMGDALGPYGEIRRRYAIPEVPYRPPTLRTTYLPYWVQTPRVAAIGRNNRTGLQVWSADHGYPGEFHYREFHKKDGISGLHYWAVSGARVDLADKGLYDPSAAQERVQGHADHFSHLIEDLISGFHHEHGRYGIISSAYDTELFGHWWFEGVDWIREVLRRLSASDRVALTTAGQFIEEHPPEDILSLPESSWGQAGNHFTWLNADTEWMWPLIHEAEVRMERLAANNGAPASTARTIALNQAGRELLLLQSSDWPFLVTTGQAADYAVSRFEDHLERFQRLVGLIEDGQDDAAAHLAAELYEIDKLFPDLTYDRFRSREPAIVGNPAVSGS